MNNKQILNFNITQSSQYSESHILINATNSHINMGVSITLRDLKLSSFEIYNLDNKKNIRNYKSIPQKYQKLYDYITTFALLNINEHQESQFGKSANSNFAQYTSGYYTHAQYSPIGLFDLSSSIGNINNANKSSEPFFIKMLKRRNLIISDISDIYYSTEKLKSKTYSEMKNDKIKSQMINFCREVEL